VIPDAAAAVPAAAVVQLLLLHGLAMCNGLLIWLRTCQARLLVL
jgi:hypothetical protein